MKLLITAATLFFLMTTPALAQYVAPSITVTPPNPAPGDTITVEVTGCQAADGSVPVYIDDVYVGDAFPDENGNYTGDYVVPEEAVGNVNVEVACENGTLASIIGVTAPDLPFQDPDDGGSAPDLPRTGANTGVLVQIGVGLVGIGAVLWMIGIWRRDNREYIPAHASVGDIAPARETPERTYA